MVAPAAMAPWRSRVLPADSAQTRPGQRGDLVGEVFGRAREAVGQPVPARAFGQAHDAMREKAAPVGVEAVDVDERGDALRDRLLDRPDGVGELNVAT